MKRLWVLKNPDVAFMHDIEKVRETPPAERDRHLYAEFVEVQ